MNSMPNKYNDMRRGVQVSFEERNPTRDQAPYSAYVDLSNVKTRPRLILPAAIVSGFQFPLLITLVGKGRENIGNHTGQIYFWNTIGSIIGSLAGGFIMISKYSATGCWIIAVLILCILCTFLLTTFFAVTIGWKRSFFTGSIVIFSVFLCINSIGPTAVWRNSRIGFRIFEQNDENEIIKWEKAERLSTIWETDGLECSVAIKDSFNGIAFIVNGKSDGCSLGDSPTQVMLGLVNAIVHPDPKTVFLIGLGIGTSAGWRGNVKSIEQVDVAEIEPVIKIVAERCGPVNRYVLKNPKVNVIYDDGREILFSSKKKYDLIISEPSNIYRSGIATLFTSEFYRVVKSKLAKGGIFSQWLQYYRIE